MAGIRLVSRRQQKEFLDKNPELKERLGIPDKGASNLPKSRTGPQDDSQKLPGDIRVRYQSPYHHNGKRTIHPDQFVNAFTRSERSRQTPLTKKALLTRNAKALTKIVGKIVMNAGKGVQTLGTNLQNDINERVHPDPEFLLTGGLQTKPKAIKPVRSPSPNLMKVRVNSKTGEIRISPRNTYNPHPFQESLPQKKDLEWIPPMPTGEFPYRRTPPAPLQRQPEFGRNAYASGIYPVSYGLPRPHPAQSIELRQAPVMQNPVERTNRQQMQGNAPQKASYGSAQSLFTGNLRGLSAFGDLYGSGQISTGYNLFSAIGSGGNINSVFPVHYVRKTSMNTTQQMSENRGM
jgi:hypothetical protein